MCPSQSWSYRYPSLTTMFRESETFNCLDWLWLLALLNLWCLRLKEVPQRLLTLGVVRIWSIRSTGGFKSQSAGAGTRMWRHWSLREGEGCRNDSVNRRRGRRKEIADTWCVQFQCGQQWQEFPWKAFRGSWVQTCLWICLLLWLDPRTGVWASP